MSTSKTVECLMGLLYQTNFMHFVSTAAYYSKHKIISLTTAIELANGYNNPQDVDGAPHTGGGMTMMTSRMMRKESFMGQQFWPMLTWLRELVRYQLFIVQLVF